jgi:hypothetical protein
VPARALAGVRVGVAAHRAIEPDERERGAKFEAAGFSMLRNRDGGEEGLFGGPPSSEFPAIADAKAPLGALEHAQL